MIHKLISEFSQLSLVIKIAISTLVSTFAGAGFIGFISEYATYYYSISNGVRIPVEGVPYLQMTITLISVALLFSIVFLLLVFSLYFYLTGLIFKYVVSKNMSKATKIVLFSISMIPLFISIAIIIAIFHSITSADIHQVYFKVVPVKYGIERYIPHIIVVFLLLLVSLGFYIYPKTKNIFISLTILVSSVVFSFSLFNTDLYHYLLQKTKMGGGYEITVKTKEGTIKKHLFLITKENMMLYDDEITKLIEIPKGNIQEYSYDAEIQRSGFLNMLLNAN